MCSTLTELDCCNDALYLVYTRPGTGTGCLSTAWIGQSSTTCAEFAKKRYQGRIIGLASAKHVNDRVDECMAHQPKDCAKMGNDRRNRGSRSRLTGVAARKESRKIIARCEKKNERCLNLQKHVATAGNGSTARSKAVRLDDKAGGHLCAVNGHCSRQSMQIILKKPARTRDKRSSANQGANPWLCSTFPGNQECSVAKRLEVYPIAVHNWTSLPAMHPTVAGGSKIFKRDGTVNMEVVPRLRSVAVLREPVARTISEYRHVCVSGVGQWDYSTKPFREAFLGNRRARAPMHAHADDDADNIHGARPVTRTRRKLQQARGAVLEHENRGEPKDVHSNSEDRAAEANKHARHDVLWAEAEMRRRDTPEETAKRLGKPGPGYINCSLEVVMKRFIVQPEHANGMQNRGVRMLAGATLSSTASATVTTNGRRTDAQMYVDAVRELNELDAIILLEQYGLSLVVMASKFGVAPPRQYSIVRESIEVGKAGRPRKEVFLKYSSIPNTPEVIDLVKQANALDIALYARAKTRLKAEGEALLGTEKAKTCTAYTCTKLDRPRNVADDLIERLAREKVGTAGYTNLKQRIDLYTEIGYVITDTCTADFDAETCFGAVRWWDIG